MAKIVLLNDRVDFCEAIKSRLVADGHDVRIARSGAEAIDFGYLFQPDVLVTDLRLKCENDGIEVAKAYRVANKKTITVLTTECSIQEVKKQAATADIFLTLAKPFSLEKLASVVEQALSQRQTSDSQAALGAASKAEQNFWSPACTRDP